jgi:hypothetical protein
LEAGLVLIFLSSLAIVVPNTDLSDRVDPPLSFIRRQLDPFGSIRLGTLQQILQCNIMTACGRKRNVFRSVVIEARIERRLAAILAADVAGRIVKATVTVPRSNLRALSTPRAPPWKSSALWPITMPRLPKIAVSSFGLSEPNSLCIGEGGIIRAVPVPIFDRTLRGGA